MITLKSKAGCTVCVHEGIVFDPKTGMNITKTLTGKNVLNMLEKKRQKLWQELKEIDPVWSDIEGYNNLQAEYMRILGALMQMPKKVRMPKKK